LLLKAKSFSSTPSFNFSNDAFFSPTNSGLNTYVKSSWRPRNSIQSYHYMTSTLADYLTKRELLTRQYLELTNKMIYLPNELLATQNNPLLVELIKSYAFNDPTTWNNEVSRSVFNDSLGFFKFTLLNFFFKNFKNPFLDLGTLDHYFFFHFFGVKSNKTDFKVTELYKNQFRPLRKGVSSMLRLHATGAIALPIEVRLQILASSRDVIHSWAIPSAGIKIDCVPGYTSHRIMIFMLEGIYWGQCMEICGRYHHWMPIVLYLMRRDLFFLWCTHFVFNTSLKQLWEINDRPYLDYMNFVNYDKSSWINEII
jgi:hypothetical protein